MGRSGFAAPIFFYAPLEKLWVMCYTYFNKAAGVRNIEILLQIIILILALPIVLVMFLFLLICGLFVDPKKQYERDSRFFRALLEGSSGFILWCLGVRYKVIGEERFPKNGNFLFISNHRSNYDPIVQWIVFKQHRLSFISKKSNFKIPMFGRLIHRCCFMPIDRENPRKAMETVNRAARLLTDTENCVGVYPEGKRSKSCRLLPFHGGVLKSAQKAGKPLVISTIEGTENVWKNIKRLKKTVVTIKILETMDAGRVKAAKTSQLSDYCAELMKNELEEQAS